MSDRIPKGLSSVRETFAEDRSDNDYCPSSEEERDRNASGAIADFNDLIEPKDSDENNSENKDEYNPQAIFESDDL